MATGTVHALTDDLHLVEGHHPHNLWDDPDLPTIAVLHSGRRLYLLDTGVGPEQRDSIREVASGYAGAVDEVVLLNSHGHVDHLGNNDVLEEVATLVGAYSTRHYISRAARPALDVEAFFGGMYRRGLPYFDYLTGLTLRPQDLTSLLVALGAPPDLHANDVADLGTRIGNLGLTPALSGFLPSVVVDILLQTYPPVHPDVDSMLDYDDLGPAPAVDLGGTSWTGWTFVGDDGEPDVHVLESGGHSAGGVVFLLPRQRTLLLVDETTSVPIWADSVPDNAVATATRALQLMDAGVVDTVGAGHMPLLPVSGDQARALLHSTISSAHEFEATVDGVLADHPDGLTIDAMYDVLVAQAAADSVVAFLQRLQFPVFSTFLKLTLLNHCLLHQLPTSIGPAGRPVFRAARPQG